jgi:hypothetical protein
MREETMLTEPERLLAKHRNVQRAIDVSASHYWGLVRAGKIKVVGRGKGGRAVWASVRDYVASLENAEGQSGKAA